MLQAFIITLREGVEADLIVGITLAYLAKVGRNDLRRSVYAALATAFTGSIAIAVLLSRLQWNQDIFEGWVMLAAAVFVVSMIFFMMKTGRKHIHSARGHHYNLEELFEDLNRRYFHGLMGRPQLTWSRNHSRNSLGHYDPAHNAIVISRVFDHPRVPRYVVEYILFHEMLHLRHPVKLRGGRRCVHSREFLAEERRFPERERARRFLRIL